MSQLDILNLCLGLTLISLVRNSFEHVYEKSNVDPDIETNMTYSDDNVAVNHPGHLKPFGHSGPFINVSEWQEFPVTRTFFTNYVHTSLPLVMRGAGQLSAAFNLWSDEYLSSKVEGLEAEETIVHVETAKKENRKGPTVDLPFNEFLSHYTDEPIYMVDAVPSYLRQDIVIPGPLQCEAIYKHLIADMVMWMSSGGTSSVVHTDSVDNIICVLVGQKSLVLVDSIQYKNKVTLDHPHGAYSGIDVDRVDYSRYPGLVDVEYHTVNLSAGDCLYIPYLWIHQVRSEGRNIAVNVWWDHHRGLNLDLEDCSQTFSTSLTLDHVSQHSFPSVVSSALSALKDHLSTFIYDELSLEEFIKGFVGSEPNDDDKPTEEDIDHHDNNAGDVDGDDGVYFEDKLTLPLKQIFLTIDKNEDGKVKPSEISLLSDKDWTVIRKQLERFEQMMEEEQQQDLINEAVERKVAERNLKSEL